MVNAETCRPAGTHGLEALEHM